MVTNSPSAREGVRGRGSHIIKIHVLVIITLNKKNRFIFVISIVFAIFAIALLDDGG